jgi:hypothetical protein
MENAKDLLRDNSILDAWIREIHADNGAFEFLYASNTHGGWIKSREYLMRAYVDISFFFSLLTLFEIYLQSRGFEVNVSTHPPACIRRAMFCYIQSLKNNMNEQDFLFRQFGAGSLVHFIMDIVLSELFNK